MKLTQGAIKLILCVSFSFRRFYTTLLLLLLPLLFLVYYCPNYYQQEDWILAIGNEKTPQNSSIEGLRIRLLTFFQRYTFLFLFWFCYTFVLLFFYIIEHQGTMFLIGEIYSGVDQTSPSVLAFFLYLWKPSASFLLTSILRITDLPEYILFFLSY